MPNELQERIVLLKHALEQEDPATIRRVLRETVPTFYEPEEVNRDQGDEVKIPNAV